MHAPCNNHLCPVGNTRLFLIAVKSYQGCTFIFSFLRLLYLSYYILVPLGPLCIQCILLGKYFVSIFYEIPSISLSCILIKCVSSSCMLRPNGIAYLLKQTGANVCMWRQNVTVFAVQPVSGNFCRSLQ